MTAEITSRTTLSTGDTFPALQLTAIDGRPVEIPDPGHRLVHLQFRRFAGCPICNLHLRSLSARRDELERAGIHEVVVFHSTDAELRKYEDDIPFTVVGDPDRKLYRRFGVEAGPRALLRPGAWRSLPTGTAHAVKTAVKKRRGLRPVSPTGGTLGLPADVLIDPHGKVVAVKYGTHAYDQWSVDEILAHAHKER